VHQVGAHQPGEGKRGLHRRLGGLSLLLNRLRRLLACNDDLQWIVMPKGFVFCVATGLLLFFAGEGVAANSDFTIETLNASIESQEGEKLRVAFATEGQPALLFRPDRGAWEWSGTSKLFIPVENPGDEPLTLLLRIESAPRGSLSGKVAMAPRSVSDLVIRLDAPAPRAMGMIAGPLFEAAGLEPHTLPVTATEGSIDTSRVTSVYLGISRPPTLQRLTVGPLRAEPPGDAERTAYDGIVDAFGQFRPGTWPEKVSSAEMLRARGAEEAKELDQWRADAPNRHRFGGLLGTVALVQPASFTQSSAPADGGWLPRQEIPFSRSGSTSLRLPGQPMSMAGSSCSGICRRETESLPRTGASETTAVVWELSAAARSIMGMPSIFILPTSSGNSAPIGAPAGAKRQ
jgi:hypothetical protein